VLHLVDGVNTAMSWPGIELRAATDEGGNDLLLLVGAEPDHSWRAFTEAVIALAQQLGCRMIVGLGAYPAATPHTRATRLSVTASTEELAISSGLLRGTLDVPAGVQAAIERRCADAGIAAMGIWAQIPHYASGMAYPAGGRALIEQLQRVAGLSLPMGTLVDESRETQERLDAIIAGNDDHAAMVRQLEEEVDSHEDAGPMPPGPLPSGDDLVAELERFLRDQGKD
jgi:predicted ATP-grasp superfamily ATP-dependent carboligase